MNRKPLLAVAHLLCVPIAILFVHGSAAESLYDYSKQAPQANTTIKSNFETSAECEERVKSQGSANTSKSGSYLMSSSQQDCRTTCQKWEAKPGEQWYGKAPSCGGRKMGKNSQPYKDCVNAGGKPLDWSYCGDGKTCATGTKILCLGSNAAATTTSAPVITNSDGSGFVWQTTYIGNPPACNAKLQKNKDACYAMGDRTGKIIGTTSTPPAGQGYKPCKTGQYITCQFKARTGGQ